MEAEPGKLEACSPMLQPERAVMAPTLKGMLKEVKARPKVWLTKRGTLLLTLQTVPLM
jgi:hypothetical protein